MVYHKKKTIVFDFDGVIHSGYRGYRDGSIYGKIDLDLLDYIKDLMKNYYIVISSNRPAEQIVKIATEAAQVAATKQVMVMMNPIIDRLDKIVQGVNAPRSEQLTFDTSDLPYTATNIGKKINRTASVTNKILLQRGILSVKDGSWTLNKQYEDKGWGKTVKGQYRGKTYVRYTEKGMQEIIKILSSQVIKNK